MRSALAPIILALVLGCASWSSASEYVFVPLLGIEIPSDEVALNVGQLAFPEELVRRNFSREVRWTVDLKGVEAWINGFVDRCILADAALSAGIGQDDEVADLIESMAKHVLCGPRGEFMQTLVRGVPESLLEQIEGMLGQSYEFVVLEYSANEGADYRNEDIFVLDSSESTDAETVLGEMVFQGQLQPPFFEMGELAVEMIRTQWTAGEYLYLESGRRSYLVYCRGVFGEGLQELPEVEVLENLAFADANRRVRAEALEKLEFEFQPQSVELFSKLLARAEDDVVAADFLAEHRSVILGSYGTGGRKFVTGETFAEWYDSRIVRSVPRSPRELVGCLESMIVEKFIELRVEELKLSDSKRFRLLKYNFSVNQLSEAYRRVVKDQIPVPTELELREFYKTNLHDFKMPFYASGRIFACKDIAVSPIPIVVDVSGLPGECTAVAEGFHLELGPESGRSKRFSALIEAVPEGLFIGPIETDAGTVFFQRAGPVVYGNPEFDRVRPIVLSAYKTRLLGSALERVLSELRESTQVLDRIERLSLLGGSLEDWEL